MAATARLAELLRLRAAEEIRACAGRDVFATPDVIAFGAWLQREWERTDPLEVLLDDAGELLLWERVIAEDLGALSEQARLLGLGQLAASAARAWDLLQRWGDPDWSQWPATAETEGFRRWSARVRATLAERDWMTRAQLIDVVANSCREGCHLTAPIVFAGLGAPESFDPATARLLEALQMHAPDGATVAVELWNGCEGSPGALHVREYPTRADEARAVAARIRADLEAARSPETVRVAVTAPFLPSYRPLLASVFAVELDAASLLATEDAAGSFVAESQAEKLADVAMVAHALDLLELARPTAPFELISRVLLAAFPRAADEEHEARARLEARLRTENCTVVSVHGASGLMARARGAGATKLADGLSAQAEDGLELARRQSPARWAETFARRLEALGWPGGDLDAREREAYEGWREALADLAALELVAGETDETEARARLREILDRRALRTTVRCAQIAVVDTEDAGAMAFDGVYVLGMTSDALPPRARVHPLLPSAWQRSIGMEEADPTKVRMRAERMWRALQASAPDVHASVARQGDGDEIQTLSPLLARRDEPAERRPSLSPWYAARSLDAAALEPRPSEEVRAASVRTGGSALLRDQAHCPFKALAAHRWKADPLPEPQLAPTPADRGSLVHEALRSVWEELRTGEALRALDADARGEIAASAAARALRAKAGRAIPSRLHAPLRSWLAEMVARWLEKEMERIQDWVVEACEREVSLRIATAGGDLELPRLRIDRIDRSAQGRAIVVDYKTGTRKSTAKAWLEARPREPQLLLYAFALEDAGDDVEAVVFANLCARDDMNMEGPPGFPLTEAAAGGRRRKTDPSWSGWDAELPRLRHNLEALATQYVAGSALVDPIADSPSPCRVCLREPLCRIFEREREDGEEGTEEGGGEDAPE